MALADRTVALTPEEIVGKQFLVALRGYDKNDVDAFLEEVAREVGHLQRALETLRQQVESVDSQSYHEVGERMATLLRDAVAHAEKVRSEAEREVEDVRDRASREAELMLEAAKEEASALRAEGERALVEARAKAAEVTAAAREEAERHGAGLDAPSRVPWKFLGQGTRSRQARRP